MINPTCLQVLQKLYARLHDTDINWVVTGSLSFALQGVPVEPHDIDLQTNEAGAYAIEQAFSECVLRKVAFSSTANIRSHFGAILLDRIKVEIMGDIQKRLEDGSWEAPVDLIQHKQIVEFEGMQIPVLSLEYEYQAYRKLGRFERAQILHVALNKREM